MMMIFWYMWLPPEAIAFRIDSVSITRQPTPDNASAISPLSIEYGSVAAFPLTLANWLGRIDCCLGQLTYPELV